LSRYRPTGVLAQLERRNKADDTRRASLGGRNRDQGDSRRSRVPRGAGAQDRRIHTRHHPRPSGRGREPVPERRLARGAAHHLLRVLLPRARLRCRIRSRIRIERFRPRINVIHDGIDTDVVRPNPSVPRRAIRRRWRKSIAFGTHQPSRPRLAGSTCSFQFGVSRTT